jgi:tetratricopeptide (TPR) repeat protein
MLLLGEWALREGRYADARLFLEQARMLDPSSLKVLERLLLIDYQERDAAALRERSAAMLALDPDHPLGLFGSASVHIAEGRYDLAEIPLRRCLGLVTFGPALNELAWILGEKGELDEALEHARLAVELMPRDPNARDTLATILDKRGELEEAAATMEQALELAGEFQVPLALRATDLLSRAGRDAEARRLLSRLQLNLLLLPPETRDHVKALAARMDDAGESGN